MRLLLTKSTVNYITFFCFIFLFQGSVLSTLAASPYFQQTPYQQAKELVRTLEKHMPQLSAENWEVADQKNRVLGKLLLQDAQAKQDFLSRFQGFSRTILKAKNQRILKTIQASKAREANYLQQINAYQEEHQKTIQTLGKEESTSFVSTFIAFTKTFHAQVMPVVKGEASFSEKLLAQYNDLVPKAKQHANPQIVRIATQLEELYQLAHSKP